MGNQRPVDTRRTRLRMKTIGIDIRMIGKKHGGIGRYVFELVKSILEIDAENSYILFYNISEEDEIEMFKSHKNVTLVTVNVRHYSIREQTKFIRILLSHKLDLMHFPNFNMPLLYNRPFVVTIHDLVHHKISGAKKSRWINFYAYKKIIEHAAKKSRSIITVSHASQKDIASYFHIPLSKIHVTYEGAAMDVQVPEIAITRTKKKYLLNRPYLLFVGVLERKKNIINLAKGFDMFLAEHGLDMDLVIVGSIDSHYPGIKFQAMEIKNAKRLVFTGFVEEQDLAALYKGAYAFVSASLHEGFGLPGVEAMRFGLPLVVSNIEVFNEIYDNAGVYFDPNDIKDIADKIFLVARDTKFHQQLQQSSLKRGMIFDWKKTAEQTVEIYKKSIY